MNIDTLHAYLARELIKTQVCSAALMVLPPGVLQKKQQSSQLEDYPIIIILFFIDFAINKSTQYNIL